MPLLDEEPRDVALAFSRHVVDLVMGHMGVTVDQLLRRRFTDQPPQTSARFA
jgi:hypothetical protein